MNSSHSLAVERVAELLLQISTALDLPSYSCVYLKDFPQLASSVDLTYWRTICIPEKVQPPPYFSSTVQSTRVALANILRTGTNESTVYYLPNTTPRLGTLVKVSC